MVGIEWIAMGEREQRRQRWGRGSENWERDVCMGVISFGSFTCCFHSKNLASDRCLFLVHYNSIVIVIPWPHPSINWPPPYQIFLCWLGHVVWRGVVHSKPKSPECRAPTLCIFYYRFSAPLSSWTSNHGLPPHPIRVRLSFHWNARYNIYNHGDTVNSLYRWKAGKFYVI